MSVPSVAGRAVRDQYRLGLGLFVTAPVAVAPVAVPEFAQHVAEIAIGMFDSRAAARALSADPTRMAFGYAKLAGLALAFLACARAVWCRLEGGRWYDLRDVAWVRLGIGFAAFMAIGGLGMPLGHSLPPSALLPLNVILSIASLPFLLVALAGLFGDRETAWRDILRRGWPGVLLLVLLFLTGFAPAQGVHMGNHLLAFGRPAAVVWALMVWDSLVVGALAALTGAAFALAYAATRARIADPAR